MKIKVIYCIMALILCMSALCVPAFASDGGETMIVNAAWLDGEMLRIDVTDEQTGTNSSLAIRLSDYIKETDNSEYIEIQAVDLDGNKSGIIQLKNPYYKPPVETEAKPISKESGGADTSNPSETAQTSEETQSAIPDGANPFTPDGTGTVTDNATDGDGKEFFTVTTEDDNVFYLIVDRQKNSDNVYLLNAVTEDDLMALAQKSGNSGSGANNGSTSAIPTPEQNTPQPQEQPQATPEPVTPTMSNGNVGTIIFILIAALIAGGVGYYFKIYKPKKDGIDTGDEDMDYEDESENDDEYEDGLEPERREEDV